MRDECGMRSLTRNEALEMEREGDGKAYPCRWVDYRWHVMAVPEQRTELIRACRTSLHDQ